jgi:CBS domain containing-hemolysin-like protein
MLENIFRFSETEIKDIMTPRPEIIWIQSETSIKNFLKIYKKNPHTRFPVCDGQLDNVIGIINVKDVMLSLISPEIDDSKSINTLCKETMFSPEMKLLDELLEEFQVSGHKITLAIDEYGDISGILTLSRCIEKIVGEAAEEGKKLVKKISKAGNDTYVVEGGIAIDEINNELKIKIPEGRYETLAGFIIDRMQTFPSKKSRTNFRGFRFTVMDMEKNKISKIQIKVPLQNIKKNVR